jgi:glyoxylase-like metal-dependent hydrolase (beta-lactamase superfamily II)
VTLRRRQLLQGSVGCWLAAAGLHCPAWGQAPAWDLAPENIADGVWYVQGQAALGTAANRNFISNAGFVITDDGVVVDALGSPVLAQALLAAIKRITAQPVTHVVVTHFHADHIYGLQTFQATGAQILAHPAGMEYLQSSTAQLRLQQSRVDLAPWVDNNTRLVAADQWLNEPNSTLKRGTRTLRIRHVGPAHTAEDLVVWDAASRVLFCGDLVFQGRLPFVGQADSRQWIASLDALLVDDPRVLVPGHGPVSLNPRADVALTRGYLQHLRRVMGAAAQAMEPFESAYAQADWSAYEKLPLFKAANRMNAYNTYLLMEQQGTR